ncbi:hypothetical protein PCASD_26804 [Puccinia coronata f. sp. avenae]|uniref:Uncharacterized protein n=1 Tax=Puccinia coronata f. sp. avenae TaxID=200324 RepID=A0A2N5RV57_9BASI|nr:hypothetical protein PCASD_26804 [Puccinia coronata f. sp. avenae]
MEETWVNQRWQGRRPDTHRIGPLSTTAQTLPALTGRTRQFERCSNSRVRPVFGQALTSRDRSDKSVQPVGSCFGWTVPVRPPVKQCPSDHRSNTAVRAPLELPCSTG